MLKSTAEVDMETVDILPLGFYSYLHLSQRFPDCGHDVSIFSHRPWLGNALHPALLIGRFPFVQAKDGCTYFQLLCNAVANAI